ncbi:MAG: OmpA family protein [Cyclobacteriaceae bacterium]|jgi:outer membrane protein OmpA-like peptidoglycan-associated protein|nr:OmpA family protein [Cyclobacteriaceae bacterium]
MKFYSAFFLIFSLSLSALAQSGDPLALLNSPYDEQNPVLSPDGKTLYFTIANHPQNVGGKKDPGDIWISIWLGEAWSAPVHAGSVLNNRDYNGVAGLSMDGTELYLLSHYSTNDEPLKTQGISVSTQTGSGWSTPKNISIPYFMNRSSFLSGQWNPDFFVFAAESYNTLGAEDIYVSFKRGAGWTEPINLGSSINTNFQESSPTLSADGRHLYFASNGRRGGLGSFDIYVSVRLDDSWTKWSTPVNLGPLINSEGRELFLRRYDTQKFALYTSTQNSDGYGDIRIINDSLSTTLPVDTVLKIVEVKRDSYSISDRKVKITGRVTNSKTGEAVVAKIMFRADSLYTTTSSRDGSYTLIVPSTKIYSIEVNAKAFVNISERLDIHTFEMNTLEMNFKLQPVEVGAVVNLKNVLFELGKTNLLEESFNELNVVVDFLKSNPSVIIELEGHTDNRGDEKKNLELSQQRVDKIKSYLVSKGISQRRIKGKGYGGTRPIATNDSEEARKLNRRVEFRILKY